MKTPFPKLKKQKEEFEYKIQIMNTHFHQAWTSHFCQQTKT